MKETLGTLLEALLGWVVIRAIYNEGKREGERLAYERMIKKLAKERA
jgi:hypothetical protein